MKGFDIYNIKRGLSSRRETEMIDLDALIDRNLSYSENRQNLEEMYGLRMGPASREAMERAGRTPRRAYREEFYQTGSTNRDIDQLLSARSPGFRRTEWGTSYVERRRNRSDRPGSRI